MLINIIMKSGTKVRILGEIAKFVLCFFCFDSYKTAIWEQFWIFLVQVEFIFSGIAIENFTINVFLIGKLYC